MSNFLSFAVLAPVQVTEVILKYDQGNHRMRGFGFVTFDSEATVERLVEKHYVTINSKSVSGILIFIFDWPFLSQFSCTRSGQGQTAFLHNFDHILSVIIYMTAVRYCAHVHQCQDRII